MRPALFALGLLASTPAGPSPDALEARVERYVLPYVQSRNFSGAILIARAGEVLLRKGYGHANEELGVPNTPQTKFHVASVSKSFTAAAILILEQEGRLRVEDPLSKFIPDYPNGSRIKVHHLLTHTSGIPNVNNFADYEQRSRFPHTVADLVAWFRDKPLEFEPGARYGYSNSNYNLLAYIIEKTSGESYGTFLRRTIFEPAGMHDTAHDGDASALIPGRASGYMPAGMRDVENAPHLDWSVKTGNGSLYSTVDDLHKWDRALQGERILNAASKRKMFTDHRDGAGYGWFIRRGQRRSVAITGRAPGFAASLERFVDDDLVVIMAGNLYSSVTHTMAPDLAAIAFGEERRALLPPQPVPVRPEVLAGYVGRYQFGPDFTFNPNMVGEVREAAGGLVIVSGGGGGTSALIPLAEDRFLDRLYGGVLTFVKDPDGRVWSLIWNFGRDYKASRIPGG